MTIDIIEIAKASMVLFAVIDILGSLPIVVKLKTAAGGTLSSGKASIVAGGIMLLFLVVGEKILSFIGIDAASFGLAG
jgi:multiple antibiotic resistance protein